MPDKPSDLPSDDGTHDHAWRKLEISPEEHLEFDQYVCDVCHRRWPDASRRTPQGEDARRQQLRECRGGRTQVLWLYPGLFRCTTRTRPKPPKEPRLPKQIGAFTLVLARTGETGPADER